MNNAWQEYPDTAKGKGPPHNVVPEPAHIGAGVLLLAILLVTLHRRLSRRTSRHDSQRTLP